MRNAFAAEITSLGESDERVVMLSGDIGNRLFDAFKDRFPDRFFNCGVAEANMIGMAAGLAMCGLRPVAYTIAPFITMRCLEQIRVDVCYHNMPVTIVGVGGGLSYSELGGTHLACEDIAQLRTLPNMTVVCPGDAVEVRLALRAALGHNGPAYIRIGKKGEPVIHAQTPEFTLGKGIVVREGKDVCLLSAGNLLPSAVQAADILQGGGVSARVVSFHTVKPMDEALLEDAFSRYSVVVVIEEHSRLGGLGGGVSEWLADRPRHKARLLRMGTGDAYLHKAAKQNDARVFHGLTPENIATKILAAIESPDKDWNAL